MQRVVSDTSPLHYLVLIDAIEALPRLFGQVLIPAIVAEELKRSGAPTRLRRWIATPPAWLVIENPSGLVHSKRSAGEEAAIDLAASVDAGLLIIDDRAGDVQARKRGLRTTGTIGVLVSASRIGVIDLREAFDRLRATNFRCAAGLLDSILLRPW